MFDTKTAILRLRVTGLNHSQASQIVALVQKWISCCGEEWTVDRLKSLKVDLLRFYAGLPPTNSHTWTRHRKDGVPKGPFSILFKLTKKQFRVAWNGIMVYTGIVYRENGSGLKCTQRQWSKAVSAIERKPLERHAQVIGVSAVDASPFCVDTRVSKTTGDPLVDYQPSPSRRAPKGFRTVPEIEGVVDSLQLLNRRPFWTAKNWDILHGTVRGLEDRIILDHMWGKERGGGYWPSELPDMGLISLIQEGGYKLRFAANPYRVYQCALQPLGQALFRALKEVPNDFTFDQEAAIPFIQKWLGEGRPACSMDLSNCSDNLPLQLQTQLLEKMGTSKRWIQFFWECCRGQWFTAPFGQLMEINWTVGTPLGLYPTFASFALLHHSLIQWCFQESGVLPDSNGMYPYVMVGDDVVIADTETGQRYRNLMESLGVPISEVKTLWSGTTAEFIGRVITEKSVVQGFKWKGRVSDNSFVEYCRQFGPGALAMLSPRQKRVIAFISDLPEPYGLGWNPFGIPLHERLNSRLESVWTRDERVRTFMGRSARVNRLLYHGEHSKAVREVMAQTMFYDMEGSSPADFLSSDLEDWGLVQMLLPGLEDLGPAIWSNIPDVVLARGLQPGAQDAYTDMLRRTSYVERYSEASALVILERKIKALLRKERFLRVETPKNAGV